MKQIVLLAALAATFAAPARAELAVNAGADVAARVEALESGVAEAQYRLRVAQLYGRPPADIADQGQPYERVQDSGGLVLRIDRLENQMRNLNGQIEQIQFQTRRLEEQLRKFQQDVDFRFQENAGRGAAPKPANPAAPRERRTDLEPEIAPIPAGLAGPAPIAAAATPATLTPASTGSGHLRRGDAFDPTANPAAPGAPRTLGATAPSAPLAAPQQLPSGPIGLDAPGKPLDLSPPGVAAQPAATLGAPAPVTALPAPAPLAPAAAPAAPNTQVASIAQSGPRLDYEIAIGHFRAGQYEAAEKALGEFVARNPKDKLASEAIFFLGESFFQRGRHREAAEQYLKISTNHARSAKGAEAMLRLGQSLNALGAKEQACASFGELPRKYPNASANLRSAAEREARRNACT